MKYIQGIVKVIIFHSEDNSYTIIKVKVTDSNEDLNLFMVDEYDYLTVTGYFPVPMRGEEIKFFGEFKEHNRYGLQYVVKTYEKLSDTSIPGLIEYLSSDLFKGVGIKTATNIVNELGKNTIKMVMDDKEVLRKVPKLSDKLVDIIYDALIENKAAENTLIQLYGYGVTPKMAMKIYKIYQNETMAIIKQNPYQLIYDIEGIGFERADIIAKHLGFSEDDPLRIKAMIMYLYNLMGINYGHTYLYRDQLTEYLEKSLNKKESLVETDKINQYIDELIDENLFTESKDIIKLKSIDYAEKNICEKIKEITNYEQSVFEMKEIDEHINMFEKIHEITYTKMQRKAIHEAINTNFFILTGGPGTGKTTVIKGIVYVYAKCHKIPILYDNPLFEIKLIAPTGRAAKRMNETTNLHAETIHRFLGYGFDGKFLFNKDNLVDAKVIIIDEASMIDVFLASQLFQSIPKDTKVIIVGDEDQLPSVGPGQVLKDLIDSDMIDYIKLNTIHRQASDSKIISLAHSVNEGVLPEDIRKIYDDRMFVEETTEHFHKRLLASMQYLINQGYDLYEDVQVLIPMYRGNAGIDAVNNLIQEAFNQNDGKRISHGNRIFKIGDKVIQLSNQIEDNIMNGDQGIIIGIDEDSNVIVDFLGNEVTYKKGDLINLKHAYAMSIHKSQGSEYKVVIMPIFRSYTIMLKKKLLYTGITRAKEKIILLGDINAFKYGIEHLDASRQSVLKERIIEYIVSTDAKTTNTEKQSKIIKDPMIPFETLGETFGDEVSPYDFLDD
jgi:exodeoxyribonuclease V alpha subunit